MEPREKCVYMSVHSIFSITASSTVPTSFCGSTDTSGFTGSTSSNGSTRSPVDPLHVLEIPLVLVVPPILLVLVVLLDTRNEKDF